MYECQKSVTIKLSTRCPICNIYIIYINIKLGLHLKLHFFIQQGRNYDQITRNPNFSSYNDSSL